MSLGLALAGGGLKGIAHIGALKALKDLDIKIDYLSGTSSGALIGTIYALGYDTDEILRNDGYENYVSNYWFQKLSKACELKGKSFIKDIIWKNQKMKLLNSSFYFVMLK